MNCCTVYSNLYIRLYTDQQFKTYQDQIKVVFIFYIINGKILQGHSVCCVICYSVSNDCLQLQRIHKGAIWAPTNRTANKIRSRVG